MDIEGEEEEFNTPASSPPESTESVDTALQSASTRIKSSLRGGGSGYNPSSLFEIWKKEAKEASTDRELEELEREDVSTIAPSVYTKDDIFRVAAESGYTSQGNSVEEAYVVFKNVAHMMSARGYHLYSQTFQTDDPESVSYQTFSEAVVLHQPPPFEPGFNAAAEVGGEETVDSSWKEAVARSHREFSGNERYAASIRGSSVEGQHDLLALLTSSYPIAKNAKSESTLSGGRSLCNAFDGRSGTGIPYGDVKDGLPRHNGSGYSTFVDPDKGLVTREYQSEFRAGPKEMLYERDVDKLVQSDYGDAAPVERSVKQTLSKSAYTNRSVLSFRASRMKGGTHEDAIVVFADTWANRSSRKEDIEAVLRYAIYSGYERIIVIVGPSTTSRSVQSVNTIISNHPHAHIQIMDDNSVSIPLTNLPYVPEHELMSENESEEASKRYGFTTVRNKRLVAVAPDKTKFPSLSRRDPIALYTGIADEHTLVRVIRVNRITGTSSSFVKFA